MKLQQVISINLEIWNNYFTKLSRARVRTGILLYPNLILISEIPNYYIIELLGMSPDFIELKLKKSKAQSLNEYLYHFNFSEDKISPPTSNKLVGTGISNLAFGIEIEQEILQERFFFQNRWATKLLAGNGLASMDMFHFGETNYIEFNDICITNKIEGIYRLKSINHLHVVSKKVSREKYKKFLTKNLFLDMKESISVDKLKGITYSDSAKTTIETLYSQFLNVYNFQNLRETTIGEFLNSNPLILQNAFQTSNIIYQPKFDWIEGNPDKSESSIIPDFLIQREDGYYDIFDLKLPYWDKHKLTKGKRKRRSFLQIVDDAIAQLANYEDYFNFEKNIDFAKKKYNIEIKDPKLIILIGNYKNYNQDEIKEASRKLKDNFMIMDYDTFNLQFYNSAKKLSSNKTNS